MLPDSLTQPVPPLETTRIATTSSQWRKLGRLFCPTGELAWMRSHASHPTPECVGPNLIRVYFGTRDAEQRSHIGWLDCELTPRPRVVRVATEPIVVPGPLGGFDDSGTSMGCVLQQGDRRLLYYIGWNLGVTVPWRNFIGLAISESAGQPFKKYSRVPIMDRTDEDPFSLSYPWVLEDNGRYRMWYGSNLTWGREHSDMGHVIKHAVSDDGIHWHRDRRVVLGCASEAEFAVTRPCVLKRHGDYHMWFCARSDRYQILRARSNDGLTWDRTSLSADLAPTPGDWDGEMTTYPAVIEHAGAFYLFYSGDGYGKSGFGVAMCDRL